MSAMASAVPAAAHPAVDEVFSSALLLTEIMRPLGLQDLIYCSAVGRLWREQAAAAARAYTARDAPALAAALRDCNLPPAACLAVACRAVESQIIGKQLRKEDRAAALADYALVVTVHDSAGDACFGGAFPLLTTPPFMCEVSARGDATQPVRAVSLPPLPPLPRCPLSLSVQGLSHTGARDVRDLRVSVDVVRHSTAQVARLWYSEPPAAGQELCSFVERGWPPSQSYADKPALVFKLKHSIPQGRLFVPACYVDPLQGNSIRALHLDLFLILQPVASSPAGAALCLLPHAVTSLHFKDINDPNPLEHDSASTSEVLTVLQSLDWAPLVALQTATPDAELTDLAALSLESGASDTGAAVCARRWPAHVDVLQQLLQRPPKKAPQWLSKPPRQLYAALLSTCNDAHAEPLAARILRGFQQPPGDELSLLVQLHRVDKDPPHIMHAPVFGAAGSIYSCGRPECPASHVDTWEDNCLRRTVTDEPSEEPDIERIVLASQPGQAPLWASYCPRTQAFFPLRDECVRAFVWLLRRNADGSLQIASLARHLPMSTHLSESPGRDGAHYILYTTVADALNDPVVHSYTMHPAHVIMRSTMIDVLRQDPISGQQPPSPRSFVQQHLTFGLNFYTVTQKDAQKAADAAASPRQPGILMREPQGMMCRMGLELRPEQADGEPALFAPMQCLEGAARLLNWYELVPPRR
jgi:hypothetical protein